MKGVHAQMTKEELQARFHLAIEDCSSVVSRLGVSPELENSIQAGDAGGARPPFAWPADRPAALCVCCYRATSPHLAPQCKQLARPHGEVLTTPMLRLVCLVCCAAYPQ
jgi:hypothetical protein